MRERESAVGPGDRISNMHCDMAVDPATLRFAEPTASRQ